MLNEKINADFIQATNSSINLELAITPVKISYDNALAPFRNQANQKYPPELSTYNTRRPRKVNEVDSMGGGRGVLFQGRGIGHYGRRGRRGCGGIFYGGRGGQYGRGFRKTRDIDGPDPMPEWYSITMARRTRFILPMTSQQTSGLGYQRRK